MKFSLTTQFKNPLDTFKIARYNILTEYKNALIGISRLGRTQVRGTT